MGIIDFTNKRVAKGIINNASENTKESATEFVKKYGKEGMIILTKVWCADKIYIKCRRCARTWNKYKKTQEEDFNKVLDEKQYCVTCNKRLKALNILRGI